jgi:hypothetical protein
MVAGDLGLGTDQVLKRPLGLLLRIEAVAGSIGWGALSTGAAIGIGAVAGFALGILVSVTTDLPLAPEVGLLLGALAGWLSHRKAT